MYSFIRTYSFGNIVSGNNLHVHENFPFLDVTWFVLVKRFGFRNCYFVGNIKGSYRAHFSNSILLNNNNIIFRIRPIFIVFNNYFFFFLMEGFYWQHKWKNPMRPVFFFSVTKNNLFRIRWFHETGDLFQQSRFRPLEYASKVV